MQPITLFDYHSLQQTLTPKVAYGTITGDMDITSEVEEVKKELTELIVQHLKENKLEVATARKLAADFLAVLPVRDQQDLLLKLKNLGTHYEEVRVLYVREMGRINEELRHQALTKMHELIQSGKIEEAIDVAHAMKMIN